MISEPFNASINGQYNLDIQPEEAKTLDTPSNKPGKYHVLHNNQSYHAELEDADYTNRRYTFKINGSKYTIKIADHYERLVQQLGLSMGGSQKTNIIKAPMPGLVLDILVKPGQSVQKGDPLLILEAMKMENIIKAVGEGQVKSLKVQKSAAVDKGQILLEME